VVPVKKKWISNACRWAQLGSFPLIPISEQDELIETMLSEVCTLYQRSVQKTIADYVLKNADERKRLYIQNTPHESLAARFQRFEFGDVLDRGRNVPPVTWSVNVSRARRFLAENLLTTNSMSIALEHLWNSSYGDQLLVNLPLEGGGTPAFLEDFKNEQYKQADATAENFRQKWHPATLRLFLSPPEDPYLDALASQSNLLFRAVRVQMTKQVRYVFERSLERVATFFERYSPLSDEEFERATQGKNEVAYMPPLKIRIILQGNKMHVRMQPSLDDFESALFSMLDHCVSAVDGIPVIQPMNLKSYSPFALPDKAEVPEKPGSDEAISADAASLSKALYTDPGMRLKVAKTDEFICGITQAKIHDILQSNIQGPRKMVERYEQFAAQMSPVPGVSILSLNQEAFGKEYRAAKHSLAEYRADVDQFRKAAAEVMELSSQPT